MLCEIICIMKMYKSLLVCIYNICWKKKSFSNILADLSCHIISLYTINSRILIGILLLYFLIIAL